ncbi:MAG: hypothetical protein FRX48_00152 [Lasallia pustulata]|uniref:Uncharacterized protein n=1 Tax=Lasallia pustulata TaxID=136370 RepID=A0A5M8Q244_9LECA|nr:MAG: hypothetical protein FRX48_00152 [Lasallia pustulata]
MSKLPTITLDTTLAELYETGENPGSSDRIAMVLCATNSEIELSAGLARNTKYLYQDSIFSNGSEHLSPRDYDELQHHSAVKYLSLVPQRDAFASGNMGVILFTLDDSKEQTIHSREEAEKTMARLSPAQRPRLLFFRGPEDISLKKHGIDLLAPKLGLDGLEAFPLTLDLETHYFLNSKGALFASGLPTPQGQLIELGSVCPDAQSCCGSCASNVDSLSIPSSCTGIRKPWLSSQISHIISRISAQPVPFVFKNQQTFGGGGTFLVSSQEDRIKLNHKLSTHVLPKLLSQVTPANAHLQPATLLLTSLVANPIGDYGLTFFVTRTGECVFISLSEQKLDSSKAWIGSKISYLAQDALQLRFDKIMRDIGAWLHRHNYYGPVGADILETAPIDGEKSSDNFHIVDLNVRTSGSLVLGLLRGHFSKRRGLHEASSFSVTMKMKREEFVERLAEDLEEGRVVVISWYEDGASGLSYANVVVGAEDTKRLEREIERVKQFAEEITF